MSSAIPGLYYQYEVCEKKFLGICTKKRMQVDEYDLRDPVLREKLRSMGFILKVRQKP